jgi:translation elongation factor EF-G
MSDGHIIENTEYTDSVTFHIFCEVPLADGFIKKIINATSGKATVTTGEEKYISTPID